MSCELVLCREVNPCGRSESESEIWRLSRVLDPKRGDLSMARLKHGKTSWRTEPTRLKTGGMSCG